MRFEVGDMVGGFLDHQSRLEREPRLFGPDQCRARASHRGNEGRYGSAQRIVELKRLQKTCGRVAYFPRDKVDLDDAILISGAHAAAAAARDPARIEAHAGTTRKVELGSNLVGMPGLNCPGTSCDGGNRVGNELMHKVEVVDHEIQNHADIGSSAGPRSKAPAGNFL